MIRLVHSVSRAMAVIAAILMGVVVLITAVNVAGFALNMLVRPLRLSVSDLPGYEDAVSLLVGIAALLFLPYCQLTRGHVSVDLFTNRLSPGSLRRLTRVTDALMAVAAAFFAVMLMLGVQSFRADGIRIPVLDWPVWPFALPGVAALWLWAVTAAMLAITPGAARSTEGIGTSRAEDA